MTSTFEMFPDEILMIIFGYSVDAYETFRSFLGLNQRLNNILVDKRLHLLAHFLHINANDPSFEKYYNSTVFRDASHQLASINTTMNKRQLRQCFQSLVVFHMKEKWVQLGSQVELILEIFQSVRQNLNYYRRSQVDSLLEAEVNDLQYKTISMSSIERIRSLILTDGTCLQSYSYEWDHFNLAKVINKQLFDPLHDALPEKRLFDDSIFEIFKLLIISNRNLPRSRQYVTNERRTICYCLFYSAYRLQDFYSKPLCTSIDIHWYQRLVDLLISVIRCQKQVLTIEERVLDLLNLLPSTDLMIENGQFIEAVQWNLFKLVLDEYALVALPSQEDFFRRTITFILINLIKKNKLDLILFLYRHVQSVRNFFNKPMNHQIIVGIMTENRTSRQLFKMIMDEKPLETWLIDENLVFLLLEKKEQKLLEKLLQLSPSLVHYIDKDGNDPLLYVCCKLNGDRYRIVELLIKMGSNLQRKNHKGEHFIDVIQLPKNKTLLELLVKENIIQINDQSWEIQIVLDRQLQE